MTQNSTKSNHPLPPSIPRWVKVFGALIILPVIIFLIFHFTGGLGSLGHHLLPH